MQNETENEPGEPIVELPHMHDRERSRAEALGTVENYRSLQGLASDSLAGVGLQSASLESRDDSSLDRQKRWHSPKPVGDASKKKK